MSETPLMSYVSPELIKSYQIWTAEAVSRLRCIMADWRAQRCPVDQARQSAYEIVHNIKGMGASFEHPLMTEAGQSLCAYLRLRAGAENELSVIEQHIDSFERILALGPGEHDNIARAQLIAPLHLLTGLAPMEN